MVVAALTETLGVQDVVAIFNGDVTAIDRIRPQLRRFFCQHVLNDNSRPSAEGQRGVGLAIATGFPFCLRVG